SRTVARTAPPRPRRRGPESVLRVGLWAVLTCIVAAALVYISFLVAVINPGGVLVDQGAFAEAPSCSDIRPAAFSTPESEGGLEGGISCEWRIKGEPFRSVVVSLGVVETNGWTSAVKEARKRMAKPVLARDSVRREEPALGPDAYSAMSRDRPDKHQVVFRKSNLIVSVHYTEDHGLGDDPDPADMRATTLKLAAEIQSKINAWSAVSPRSTVRSLLAWDEHERSPPTMDERHGTGTMRTWALLGGAICSEVTGSL